MGQDRRRRVLCGWMSAKLVTQTRDTLPAGRVSGNPVDGVADGGCARTLGAEVDAQAKVADPGADLVLPLIDARRHHRHAVIDRQQRAAVTAVGDEDIGLQIGRAHV